MPREYVGDRERSYTDEAGAAHVEHPFLVSVGWNREAGYVQVATVEQEVDGSGLYVDLTRRTINDLIRVLRRARDQAFGKDE